MASFNKVILLGNLTRDPEVRYTPKGTAVTDLGLAVNRTYTADNGEKREEVTFVDVTFWGRTAEVAGEYLGKRLRFSGSMKAEDVKGWAGFWMRLDAETRRCVGFDNMQERAVKGTEPEGPARIPTHRQKETEHADTNPSPECIRARPQALYPPRPPRRNVFLVMAND